MGLVFRNEGGITAQGLKHKEIWGVVDMFMTMIVVYVYPCMSKTSSCILKYVLLLM